MVSTICVGGILTVVTVLVLRSMWKRKKRTGTFSGCGCDCDGCPHAQPGYSGGCASGK